jgi:hypothetical protein
VVHKKTDPKYALVRGHVPKALLKRFKSYCLDNDLDYSQGLENVLSIFFELLDKGEILARQDQNLTIADLIRDWDLDELARLSEVPVENLQAILAGERPTNDDLIGLGIVLCKENGEPWTTEELVEIRDGEFSQMPQSTPANYRNSPQVR